MGHGDHVHAIKRATVDLMVRRGAATNRVRVRVKQLELGSEPALGLSSGSRLGCMRTGNPVLKQVQGRGVLVCAAQAHAQGVRRLADHLALAHDVLHLLRLLDGRLVHHLRAASRPPHNYWSHGGKEAHTACAAATLRTFCASSLATGGALALQHRMSFQRAM